MQYVETSALLRRYVREPDSADAQRLLLADPRWVTGAHTEIEVRRNLARRLGEAPEALTEARRLFTTDWARTAVVSLDSVTCRLAAELAELTGARSLDAMHLAAAQRAGAPAVRLVAYDVRLAQAARTLGWTVVGA